MMILCAGWFSRQFWKWSSKYHRLSFQYVPLWWGKFGNGFTFHALSKKKRKEIKECISRLRGFLSALSWDFLWRLMDFLMLTLLVVYLDDDFMCWLIFKDNLGNGRINIIDFNAVFSSLVSKILRWLYISRTLNKRSIEKCISRFCGFFSALSWDFLWGLMDFLMFKLWFISDDFVCWLIFKEHLGIDRVKYNWFEWSLKKKYIIAGFP